MGAGWDELRGDPRDWGGRGAGEDVVVDAVEKFDSNPVILEFHC